MTEVSVAVTDSSNENDSATPNTEAIAEVIPHPSATETIVATEAVTMGVELGKIRATMESVQSQLAQIQASQAEHKTQSQTSHQETQNLLVNLGAMIEEEILEENEEDTSGTASVTAVSVDVPPVQEEKQEQPKTRTFLGRMFLGR